MMKTLDIISVTRSDNLNKFITKNNESVYAFCQRTGEDYPSINKYINKTLKMGDKVARRLEKLLGINEGAFDAGVPSAQFAELPILDSIIPSGTNIKSMIKQAAGKVLLEEEIIKSFGWNKDSLLIVVAKDDAMEPTIQEGTKAIIDYSQTSIQANKIYALRIREDVYLRRIMRSPSTGNLTLIADSATFHNNKNYETQEITHNDYEIIGRVVLLRDALV